MYTGHATAPMNHSGITSVVGVCLLIWWGFPRRICAGASRLAPSEPIYDKAN
jgi:hypothetical protein